MSTARPPIRTKTTCHEYSMTAFNACSLSNEHEHFFPVLSFHHLFIVPLFIAVPAILRHSWTSKWSNFYHFICRPNQNINFQFSECHLPWLTDIINIIRKCMKITPINSILQWIQNVWTRLWLLFSIILRYCDGTVLHSVFFRFAFGFNAHTVLRFLLCNKSSICC